MGLYQRVRTNTILNDTLLLTRSAERLANSLRAANIEAAVDETATLNIAATIAEISQRGQTPLITPQAVVTANGLRLEVGNCGRVTLVIFGVEETYENYPQDPSLEKRIRQLTDYPGSDLR